MIIYFWSDTYPEYEERMAAMALEFQIQLLGNIKLELVEIL